MAWVDEAFTAAFARWEERGRGWQVWPAPVKLEPPFVAFPGYNPDTSQFPDDGRSPSFLTSALTALGLFVERPAPPPRPP